jgi:hypothetical protein
MNAKTKKKLEFLKELGLCQNEINEIMDKQEILNQYKEVKESELTEKWKKDNSIVLGEDEE